jgi:hypothetical protein
MQRVGSSARHTSGLLRVLAGERWTRLFYFVFFAAATRAGVMAALDIHSSLHRVDDYYSFAFACAASYWTAVLALLQVPILRRNIGVVRRVLAAAAAVGAAAAGVAAAGGDSGLTLFWMICFLVGPGLGVWSAASLEQRQLTARAEVERRAAEDLASARHAELLAALTTRPDGPGRQQSSMLTLSVGVAAVVLAARLRRR